jgi:hypothetical protein
LVGAAVVLAACELRLAQIPIVRIHHLSEVEKRAYRIAANKLGELSDWVREELILEFKELAELDPEFPLEFTGFCEIEIETLVIGDTALAEEAPPPSGPPISRRGDVWVLGSHRLMCGDATDPKDYQALLQGEVAAAAFTDPPYNVAINGHVRTTGDSREFHGAVNAKNGGGGHAGGVSCALALCAPTHI